MIHPEHPPRIWFRPRAVLRARYTKPNPVARLRQETLCPARHRLSAPRTSLSLPKRPWGTSHASATRPHQGSLSNGCSNYPPQNTHENPPDRWATVCLMWLAKSNPSVPRRTERRSEQHSPGRHQPCCRSRQQTSRGTLVFELDEVGRASSRDSSALLGRRSAPAPASRSSHPRRPCEPGRTRSRSGAPAKGTYHKTALTLFLEALGILLGWCSAK